MKKENFSKAMSEMFGVGGDSGLEPQIPAAEPVMAPVSEPFAEMPEMYAAPEPMVQPAAPAVDPFAPAAPYTPPAPAAPAYSSRPAAGQQKTILAPGTTFVGNMTVQGDVDMDCEFQGDIQAGGTVTIRTRLAGDLNANIVELVSCEIQGDVHAAESIRVDNASKVIGNITGKDLICAGNVQGNIQVSGHVTISGSAYIEGDLEAASISVENGAGINGQMQVLPRNVQ